MPEQNEEFDSSDVRKTTRFWYYSAAVMMMIIFVYIYRI